MERLGRSNPRVKWLRRAVRERPAGRVVVDGKKLVEDLVRWGVTLRELYLAEGLERSPVAAAAERTFLVAEPVLQAIAPTRHPQGILALVDEPAASEWIPRGVVALLEGVQDPGNVGAVVRSAAGLGLDAVVLSPGCADPWHPAAVRGSAGAVFRLPLVRDAAPSVIAARVKKAGGSVWAAGLEGRDVRTWRPRRPVLVMLGSEGAGLTPETFDLADELVSIPLSRDVESLNVAVAAGILLWHATGAGGEPRGNGL